MSKIIKFKPTRPKRRTKIRKYIEQQIKESSLPFQINRKHKISQQSTLFKLIWRDVKLFRNIQINETSQIIRKLKTFQCFHYREIYILCLKIHWNTHSNSIVFLKHCQVRPKRTVKANGKRACRRKKFKYKLISLTSN